MYTFLWLIAIAAALPVAGALYQTIGTARDARRFPPPGRLIEVCGQRLHLREMGTAGPVVIFESGIAASTINWTVVQRETACFARTYSYERAGFGWSDAARTPRHVPQIAGELRTLLQNARVPFPVIFVGHSFGGLIGRYYASQWPEEIAGMILLDPVATSEWTEAGMAQRTTLERGARLSRRGGMLARVGVVRLSLDLLMAGSRVIPRVVGRAASGAGVHVADRLVGEVRKMPRELWPIVQAHWSLPKCFASMGDHLRRLPDSASTVAATEMPASIPLAVLLAADANLLRRREYSALAGTHAVTVPNSGHWIQLDQPHLVVEAIREMLTRLASPSADNDNSQSG